jgi:arginase family enzyme
MNGDHNNMAYVVGGFHEATKKKPIVIYLDVHTDARNSDDGPHSGTWLTEVFEKGQCAKAYAVGISLFSNNAATIDNMERFGVEYKKYTWDNI